MRAYVAPQISKNLGRHPTKSLKRLASPLAALLLTVRVRPRKAHRWLHLPLPRRERPRGRPHQATHHQESRPQGSRHCLRRARTLAMSVGRYAERAIVLSQLDAGNPEGLTCKRIGPPLLFGRLWEETGCAAVIAIFWPAAASSSPWSAPCSPPCCTGSWCPALTAPARSRWPYRATGQTDPLTT